MTVRPPTRRRQPAAGGTAPTKKRPSARHVVPARKVAEKDRGFFGALRSAIAFIVGAILTLFVVLIIGTIVALGLGFGNTLTDYLVAGLPSVERAVDGRVFRTAMVYDRKGRLIDEIWDPQAGKRIIVPLKDMPTSLIDATLATEDPRFYENPGFDAAAILRAFWQNIRGQSIMSGASTITQQLVRNSLIEPDQRYERSYTRKIKEVVLAYQLSQRFTKEEILARYLNEICYGNLAYGVEAAAQAYFGKHVGELTVGEAAMLAGLPQAPALNDPLTNPRQAKDRQAEVLGLMVRHGYLAQSAADAAGREQLDFQSPKGERKVPHFANYVRNLLEERYSREQLYYSGLQVQTTIDLDLQAQAEQLVHDQVLKLQPKNARNASLVAIDPRTGEILALVGSADYTNDEISGQVNMAIAGRQAGATLKPFTYLAAIDRGRASPASVMLDEPTSFSGGPGAPAYQPRNPDGKFRGPVTLRRALAMSLNVPAVKLLAQIGVPSLLDSAHMLGINSLNQPPEYYGLALALGSGEVRLLDLTYAYGVLANGGVQVGEPVPDSERQPARREFRPVAISKVNDATGKVLEEYHPSGKAVASPGAAWLVTDILADESARAEAFGANSPLKLSRPAAAISGTTDEDQDTWTIGYTPELAVGVWMGNASNESMRDVTGLSGPGVVWHDFVEAVLKDTPVRAFDRPAGVIRATVDAKTGLRPGPTGPTITDWFLESSVPKQWALPTLTPTLTPTTTPRPTPTPRPTATAKPSVLVPPTPTENPTTAEPATPVPAFVTTMPKLVGLSEADARAALDAAGLTPPRVNYQTADDVFDKGYFNSFAVGQVVSQIPPPGTRVQRGGTVDVAVRKK